MAAAMDTQEIKKEQEGYQTAFKATALFGGVQVINILVSILKSKSSHYGSVLLGLVS